MEYKKIFCGIVATLLVAVVFMNTAVAVSPVAAGDPFADNIAFEAINTGSDPVEVLEAPNDMYFFFIQSDTIVAEFTDNMMIPSLDTTADLILIMPPVEIPGQILKVEISPDNLNWILVSEIYFGGMASPGTQIDPLGAHIDIDANIDSVPVLAGVNYKYVRLSDQSQIPNYELPVDAIQTTIMHPVIPVEGPEEIPEFPTIALPVAAIIGLAFFMQRRNE